MHTYIFNKLDHKVWRLKKLYPIIRHAEHFKKESWSITSNDPGEILDSFGNFFIVTNLEMTNHLFCKAKLIKIYFSI